MFFLLFVLWLIFNARVTVEIVVIGLVLSAALTAFGRAVFGWSREKDLALCRLLGHILAYLGRLFVEILKANLAVIRIILTPRLSAVEPRLFFFDSHLETELAKTALANSITITPGTYTVGIYGSTFAVHALNGAFEAGTPDSAFDKSLLEMEQAVKKGEQK